MMIWDQCTRLVAAIILYYNAYILNYLYVNAQTQGEKDLIVALSPGAWIHINMLGFYHGFTENHQRLFTICENMSETGNHFILCVMACLVYDGKRLHSSESSTRLGELYQSAKVFLIPPNIEKAVYYYKLAAVGSDDIAEFAVKRLNQFKEKHILNEDSTLNPCHFSYNSDGTYKLDDQDRIEWSADTVIEQKHTAAAAKVPSLSFRPQYFAEKKLKRSVSESELHAQQTIVFRHRSRSQ